MHLSRLRRRMSRTRTPAWVELAGKAIERMTERCAVRLPPLGVPVHAAPPIHVSYQVFYHVSYHVSYHVPIMTYARLFSEPFCGPA